ncbi:MAG TPA: glycosyltransferase [Solirubrobacteraceae bacterium]|nr:glycosyltransferase [Solirubrobacteraceae bacterium]
MTVVHQLLSGAGPHDAITTEAGVFRRYFADWGWGGGDYAYRRHPALQAPVAPAGELAPAPDDVVLLHHSAGWPDLDEVLALPGRKLLLYHNVTPAGWFWIDAPGLAAHCQVGRDQLGPLVRAADATAADSAFNAGELAAYGAHHTEVIHLLLDAERLGAGAGAGVTAAAVATASVSVTGEADGAAPQVLFVGRLSPHKRQDEVIRTFGLFRRRHAPGARLDLIGDASSESHVERLRGLVRDHAPGAVRIESGLPESELARRYRDADLFLCLSEHEGFCIPLLEAFSFGVPVIARPFGAIPEVSGSAALLVPDADIAVVAELMDLVLTDPGLRQELVRRGHERLDTFRAERIAPRLRAAVQRAEGGLR